MMASGRATDMLRALNNLVKNRTERDAELFVGWMALQEVALLVSRDLARAVEATSRWGSAAYRNSEQRCLALAEALLGWVVFAPFAATMATDAIRHDVKVRTPRSYSSETTGHLGLDSVCCPAKVSGGILAPIRLFWLRVQTENEATDAHHERPSSQYA